MSDLNRFIDTTEFIYVGTARGCILPDQYRIQNLKNGKYYQFFLQDTNKIAFELIYKEKKLISFKSFWFNDTLRQTGQLTGGFNEGKWTGYFRNGKVSDVFLWTHGVHHEFYFYFENGTLQRHSKEVDINNGKHRLWENEDYYSNGQLMRSGLTKDGYKFKTWKYYNKDGTLKEIKNHKKPEWLGPADWTE